MGTPGVAAAAAAAAGSSAHLTKPAHSRRRRNRCHPGSGGDACRTSGDDPRAGAAARGDGGGSEGALWRHQGKTGSLALVFGLALLAVGCAPLVRAASAGASHTCVVLVGGSIKCWGDNYWGQVGQNDALVRGEVASEMGDNLPTVPLGDFEAAYVSSGSEFNCALAVTGEVKCWGRNQVGQLGLGDLEQRGGANSSAQMGDNLPTLDLGTGLEVEELALAAGSHACAVFASGGLKCWGFNGGGQLGLGDTENRGDEPGEMGDALDFVDLGTGVTCSSVSLGAVHTCAVVDDGDVKCWGNNDGGQLGYEDTVSRGDGPDEMGDFLPVVDLGRDQRAIAVSAGFYHTCALLYTGNIKCWGFGSSGQLGQDYNVSIGNAADTMGDNLAPVDLGTGRTAIAMSLGGTHSCAVLDDASVKCWGGNKEAGSLGLGDLTNRGMYPGEMGDNLPAVGLTFGDGEGAASNIFAGRYHTCVSGTEGGLACFGLNGRGQLGAGTDDGSLGDEPGEVEAITSVNLGSTAVALAIPAPGDGVQLESIPPTPAPAARGGAGAATFPPYVTATRGPITPGSETPSPLVGDRKPGTADDGGSDGSGSDNSDVAITAAIASAAVVIPLLALVALCFCCRRRRQKRREGNLKGPSAAVAASGANGGGGYGRDDSFTSSDNNVEANGEAPPETLSGTPLVKPHALQSSAPMTGGVRDPAYAGTTASGLREQASIETLEDSSEDLPRPAATAAAAAAAPVPSAPLPVGQSDDDDSSRDERSDLENPSELRRSGSNSSISTLGSTSTASSTWPTEHGYVTPARTDIARGTGGRYGGAGGGKGKGGGHAGSTGSSSGGGGVEGLAMVGFKTPGNRGTSIPETPSPRSVSSSVHGTPAPPEMRLAQFARASAAGGDANLYGLPEMEIGRSTSNVFDSNPAGTSWPVGSKGGAPLTAASIAAAGASAAAAAAGGDSSNTSPDNSSSPVLMGPTLTPSRARHRGGGLGDSAGGGDTGGGRKSARASRTSTASPVAGVGQDWAEREGGGGMGAEAAAQAFTEEAELEALQIDKNDLKLVFGRPFARGVSSEVYQVTHAGKNRAAKIIDLFSLGVVGEEVTRLYASFAQELRAMKGIRHECVAAVYGAVATPSELTIVTDLVKRGALRTLLSDKKKRESLTPAIRHKIIKDVASGMAYLSEQGLQHRNLHSHNVLITKEWGAKVADYGLSGTREVMLGAHDRAKGGSGTGTGSKRRSRPTFRTGTLRWMAPELLQPPADGADPFTEASDVYSVGVIAWEVVCGGSTLPYDGLPDDKVTSMIIEGSTPPVSMETPIGYNKLMLLCWRKNPASRPTFSHIASVLLEDIPPAPKASPRPL